MTVREALRPSRLAAALRRPPRTQAIEIEPTAGSRVLAWSFGILAILALWLLVFVMGLSGLQYQHDQHGLYAQFREQLSAATAPVGGAIAEGSPVALLDAPQGHLNGVVVVEGTSSGDLRAGPGHFPGNPLPGQAGVALIMGRSTSYGAPFAGITDLAVGDPITVTTGQGVFHYKVEDVRQPGDPYPPALAAGAGQLTLATSAGDGWQSGWAPTHAVFVDALLTDKVAPSPGGLTVAKPADALMSSDTSGLYPLVLWLELLAVGVVGIIWLRSRWGIWQGWLVGIPVVLAALWGASSNAWLLAPNLF